MVTSHCGISTIIVCIVGLAVFALLWIAGPAVCGALEQRVVFPGCSVPHAAQDELAAEQAAWDPVHEAYIYGDPQGQSRLMFLHGNGAPAPVFCEYVTVLRSAFPTLTVVVPEYAGYGRLRTGRNSVPSRKAIVQRLTAQWAALMAGARTRILMGFSLGGALAYDMVDRLAPRTSPTQLVLANTFASLRHIHSVVDWVATADLKGWSVTNCRYQGPVLVVYAPLDQLFSPVHAKTIRDHFVELHRMDRMADNGGIEVTDDRLWNDMCRVVELQGGGDHSLSLLQDTRWVQCIAVD
jgi:hypothetical protein